MINRVVLVGRLTRDPELRKTNNGTSVTTVTVAVDNQTRDAEGNKTTSFIPVTVWNQSANYLCDYSKKGTLVGVDGRLTQRSYKRNDGTNAQVVEVVADRVTILSPKGESNANGTTYANDFESDKPYEADQNLESADDLADDDLPF